MLPTPTLIIICFVAATIGAVVFHKIYKTYLVWRMQRRFRKGLKAESAACKLLENLGYSILSTQPVLFLSLVLDQEKKKYKVRPDILVKKNGALFFAEVKTGRVAGNPLNRDTRRQLLEYSLASNSCGLLLVNMETKIVHTISFPQKETEMNYPVYKKITWVCLGVLIAYLTLKLQLSYL